MYVTRLSCTCKKRIKGRKEKKRKLDKMKSEKRKEKRENKINTIIFTRIYLPGSGAKNLTRPKD